MESSSSDEKAPPGGCFPQHDNEWSWLDPDREYWELAENRYQKFYKTWRDKPSKSDFPNAYPYDLSLGTDEDGPLLPFRSTNTLGDRILVTKAYDDVFHRILRLRAKDLGGSRGAVITGQPGVGTTTFLKFMLVRLISDGQVVVLCDSFNVNLFYGDQVYRQAMSSNFRGLPERKGVRYHPIWALIDVDYDNRGPPMSSATNIWPVQASSPKPIRWKAWRKQNKAGLFGIPLWNTEELTKGLRLCPSYDTFQSTLAQCLPLPDKLTFPTTNGLNIDAALKVLHAEREAAAVEEEDKAEDETGDSARPPATDQDVNMGDDTDRSPVSQEEADNAIKILVRNATEEFGFIPRDVYNGIFDFPTMKREHTEAVRSLDHSQLKIIVREFTVSRKLDEFSHRIVAVYPRNEPDRIALDSDEWAIDFKSVRIAREVMESMRFADLKEIREACNRFYMGPPSSCIAGWYFQKFVHRMFCSGGPDSPTLQPIRMVSNNLVPPLFSTGPSPTHLLTDIMLPPSPLRASTRAVTSVDFAKREVSNVTLESDNLYTPTAANLPLFDSFTIDLRADDVIISIFQVTMSPWYEGSDKGYVHIRKIMRRVRKLLKDQRLDREPRVVYWLVCPEDESQYRWQMPDKWNQSVKIDDHRGPAYCLRVPI